MGNKCTGKEIQEEPGPRILNDKEIQLMLDNTGYTREEIIQWHDGFIVTFSFFFKKKKKPTLLINIDTFRA